MRQCGEGTKTTYSLKLVVCCTPDVLVSIPYDPHHMFSCLSFVQAQSESISEPFNGSLSLERRQASIKHQMDGVNQLFRMWSNDEERFNDEMLKQLVTL